MIRTHGLKGRCALGIALVATCVLGSSGCFRTYTFNGVPFADPVSATAAAEAYYANLEKNVTPANTQLPLDVLMVVPSRLYVRTHWVRVVGNPAAVTEDMKQYTVNIRVRDAETVARCLKKSNAFRTVRIVDALPGTLDPSQTDLAEKADVVMKCLPSQAWGIGPFPAGPCVPLTMPNGLQGSAWVNAFIAAAQQQAKPTKEEAGAPSQAKSDEKQ